MQLRESLSGSCSTVLLVESAEASFNGNECHALVHSAIINSTHISILSYKRTKADCLSNVLVMKFPNIVLWIVVWCFGRDADIFRGSESTPLMLSCCSH